jgi:NarL family two-component system response regulator LiaR
MAGIRILVVDDHAVIRSGLRKVLMVNRDLEPVGEATDGIEAVQKACLCKPDVVLMDLMMPEMDGIAATREIRQKHPPTQVIVLSSYSEAKLVRGALQAGAIGYLEKNVTASELGNAIRSAHAGRMTLSPEAAQALASCSIHERTNHVCH